MSDDTQVTRKNVMRVPNFIKHYVTNIMGGTTMHDFRYELMNERVYNDEDKQWDYVSDGLLILSPIAAKRLLLKLSDDVNFYERENGEIQTEFENEPTY